MRLFEDMPIGVVQDELSGLACAELRERGDDSLDELVPRL